MLEDNVRAQNEQGQDASVCFPADGKSYGRNGQVAGLLERQSISPVEGAHGHAHECERNREGMFLGYVHGARLSATLFFGGAEAPRSGG